MMSVVDLRPADERFVTRGEGVESRHSFSFGPHYDPHNTSFGLLVASNEIVLAAGAGFEMHEHRDMEIVTWVLQGALEHRDSYGHVAVIQPGVVQQMSAGRGILHSEKGTGFEATHLVQMWVVPDETGIEPSYEHRDVSAELRPGDLAVVASGRPGAGAALRIHQRDATLYAARLHEGAGARLPEAPNVHLFVTRGSVNVEAVGTLDSGDALRVTDSQGQRVEADDDAEILVWELL